MRHSTNTGSMLIEVAASVAVLGLLAATSFGIFRDANVAQEGRAAAASIHEARQRVLEFALANGRLPCPDMTGNGVEGDAAGNCPPAQGYGFLPTHSLGMDADASQTPNRRIRYGIARMAPDADLGASATTGDPDPAKRFLARAERAAAYPATTSQPFIPKTDARGLARNCQTPGDNPAFVISAGRPEELGATVCFPVADTQRNAATFMGRHELVGWIRSKFRSAS